MIGALIWLHIFRGSIDAHLAFKKFHYQQVEALGVYRPSYEALLQGFQTDSDTITRRTYLHALDDSAVCETHQAAVELLKHRTAEALVEHLSNGGLSEDADVKLIHWAQVLSDVTKAMLLLKCKESCAREPYDFFWPRRGEAFDGAKMENTVGDREVVLASVFPGLAFNSGQSGKMVANALVKTARVLGMSPTVQIVVVTLAPLEGIASSLGGADG